MTAKNDDVGTGQGDRVPQYLIERLVAGDLTPARAADVRRRLALEPDGAARLDELAASNARILDDHPPRVIAAEIHRRASAARPAASRPASRWSFAIGGPTLAIAAVALVLWLRPPVAPTADGLDGTVGDGSGDRIKGPPSLRVYRKNAGRIERLKDGAPAHAGDQLQVAYLAAGHRFGVVLSVDGAGQVTFHLPPTGGKAVRLSRGGEVALPEAYELDAAPGFERFLLIVGDAPFDTSALTAVVRGAGPAPAGTVATWFTVRKE